jgi:zinc transporter 1
MWRDRNARLLLIMIALVAIFALAEIVGGIVSGSLALLSDAFHMISDATAMAVGLVSLRLALRGKSPEKSYGWQRAQVIGAFANGVFLLAACFFIALEAIERMAVSRAPIEQPYVMLGVGIGGLLVNLIGVALFFSHRTLHDATHGGHSHSHSHSHSHDDANSDGHNHGNLNMHGVFLHVLGDTLGSVVVILTSLLYIFVDNVENADWLVFVDPLCSLLLALFIACSGVPLIRHSIYILMQSTPRHIDSAALTNEIAAVDGVLHVHALHIWQMTEERAVGSVHIACRTDGPEFATLCRSIKRIMHKHDVHNTAVQPEFIDCKRHAAGCGGKLHSCEADGYFHRYGRRHRDSCCDMTTSSSSESTVGE